MIYRYLSAVEGNGSSKSKNRSKYNLHLEELKRLVRENSKRDARVYWNGLPEDAKAVLRDTQEGSHLLKIISCVC